MFKTVSYVAVCVVSFVVGGITFPLIGGREGRTDEANNGRVPLVGAETGNSAPRSFAVEGMTCQGCVDTITSALTAMPGVRSAKVSLAEKRAEVVADEQLATSEKIVAAIVAAGYKARPISSDRGASAATPAAGKQPVLVNITRGKKELHAVSMAIGLAQSAIKDGRPAIVYLNVEAPVFAAKDLGDDVQFADFPPIRKMLADFVATGGRVLVCDHCTHVAKLGPAELINGAKSVARDELLNAVPTDAVVFSY